MVDTVSDLLEKELYSFLQTIPSHTQVWIAYSGGVDSHALLSACTQFQKKFPTLKFSAIHIHHGLLPNADAWVEHCATVCKALQMNLVVNKVNVSPQKGESVEAVAREKRYDVLKTLIKQNNVLLTAHHQDDQAETCLLQFLRGAGIKGLAAMPAKIKFGAGYLARPLLNISRKEILEYANDHQLNWIEDDSNHDTRFTRNFLRYQMMPLLKERWPNVGETMMRVASHAAEADQLLEEYSSQDLQNIQGRFPQTLSIEKLKAFSLIRQKHLIRAWIHTNGFLLPSAMKLNHVIQDVMNASDDASPCVEWKGAEVRRYQDDLYLMTPLSHHDFNASFEWDVKKQLQLSIPGVGTLSSENKIGKGIKKNIIDQYSKLNICFRQGGERCVLPYRKGSHPLKKLFQEWEIPTWMRERIPLVYVNDQLAMIVGYAVCAEFKTDLKEEGVVLRLLDVIPAKAGI